MKNKILIIKSSNANISPLFDLFNALEEKGYDLLFSSNDKLLIKYCKEKNKLIKEIKNIFLNRSFFTRIFFIACLPLGYVYVLIKLIYYKLKFKIKHIVCFNIREKILFTPVAKILKIKTVWLELPGEKKEKSGFILNFLLKKISKLPKVIIFEKLSRNNLIKSGFNSKKISFVAPSINLKQRARQEDIFHDLAKYKNSQSQKKFFTIGTIVELNSGQTIEILFGAVKKALDVIPNLQIIIIGEGEERKKLTWLAKKMEIDNLTWFVGEQIHLSKWFDGFDIFSSSCLSADLNNIFILLNAMNVGLPIISVENRGFDDIIENNKNGLLLSGDDSELLAGAIIKLQQNKILSKKLGQNAKDTIRDRMNLDLMVRDFLGVLRDDNV